MKIIKSLYIYTKFYSYIASIACIFLLSYWITPLYSIAWILTIALAVFFLFDMLLLFRTKQGLNARRMLPKKFSNSDENAIPITIENNYPFNIHLKIIDELPEQFQKRDFSYKTTIATNEAHDFDYSVRPVERGEYHFGNLNAYVSSRLNIVARRYRFDKSQMVAVYPSYIQMRKYEFLAMSNRLTDIWIKKNS